MNTVLAFVVVVGILIVVHELGHFLTARATGVGVERFSFGFGPVLLRWKGPETEYCLSAIPMGGYVKMVGEESPLEAGAGGDPARAFGSKPLWVRFAIVVAGPGMNFVLAAVVFAGVYALAGRPVTAPVIGRVDGGGPAAAAGLESGDVVLAVGGRAVRHWEDVEAGLATATGAGLRMRVQRAGIEREVTVIPARVTRPDPVFGDPVSVWDLGARPRMTPLVGSVAPGSPAERAGLRPDDAIRSAGGTPVSTPEELMQAIRRRPGQRIELEVERAGGPLRVPIVPDVVRERGTDGRESEIGRIGIGIVTRATAHERAGTGEAVWLGVARTWDVTRVTVRGMWKLVAGQLDASNLGGPIQIATEAGRQASAGLVALAGFVAIISINLGVLNLLPIPLLDGGHVLFLGVEAVLGRPLSEARRALAQRVGLAILLAVMGVALYNDLGRLGAFRWWQ